MPSYKIGQTIRKLCALLLLEFSLTYSIHSCLFRSKIIPIAQFQFFCSLYVPWKINFLRNIHYAQTKDEILLSTFIGKETNFEFSIYFPVFILSILRALRAQKLICIASYAALLRIRFNSENFWHSISFYLTFIPLTPILNVCIRSMLRVDYLFQYILKCIHLPTNFFGVIAHNEERTSSDRSLYTFLDHTSFLFNNFYSFAHLGTQ